jgi:hypothetical protein
MTITQIESNLQALLANFKPETFIYDFLLAYGHPKASIARLQKGGRNLSKNEGEILWKKKLFFKVVTEGNIKDEFEVFKIPEYYKKHEPRFLIITDFTILHAFDTKTAETLEIEINELANNFDFFLPLAGMEKHQAKIEQEADVKAAERMAKLYDEIQKDNSVATKDEVHNLNVFLSRLLFCYFAEDTGIFEQNQFTHAISSHTQADGSDLAAYLDTLFTVLNNSNAARNNLPAYLNAFPYVNGGLFRNAHTAPTFTAKSRRIVIECGELQWRDINPDIFGSMIQAVITPEHRGGLGMHYTSVPNIMKVIEPLFLNDLYEVFEANKTNLKALNELLKRIWNIKIFDPACGSGNFLIIAYKELRRLEMLIFAEIDKLKGKSGLGTLDFGDNSFSSITLDHFYGIEIDDFAHEVAILSLWLAEHQMNQEFRAAFGRSKPALPLQETGNIVHGNATRVNWEIVCPKLEGDEIYILGNPPYLGARVLDEGQKSDMKFVFLNEIDGYNDLDYVACWFFKGQEFIKNSNSKCALVSTNSICQGSQVANLWPIILNNGIEIDFVHQSFIWKNSAKANAKVIVIILGIRNQSNHKKYIFKNAIRTTVKNISPYLIASENTIVYGRRESLSKVPSMNFGSMPNDGGFLTLSGEEYFNLIGKYTGIEKFIKKYKGSQEFINDIPRWCIWIDNEDLQEALNIGFLKDRIELVKNHRNASDRQATKNLANASHRFAEVRFKKGKSIIVPRVSSERRLYMPIGFLDDNFVISDSAQAIYDAETCYFAMITSTMHMTWLRAIAGRLKSDYRYSTALCYNTFPFPPISEAQKQELEKHVYRILEEREQHSEKTLAQLYDPDKMPNGLLEAHHQNDLAIERCYRAKPFESDEERLEYLFKLYEQMIEEEKVAGTLFAGEKKSKKRKG